MYGSVGNEELANICGEAFPQIIVLADDIFDFSIAYSGQRVLGTAVVEWWLAAPKV
jgi:hypothetical protein